MKIDFNSDNFGNKLNKSEKIDLIKKIYAKEEYVVKSLEKNDYCLNDGANLTLGFCTMGGGHRQFTCSFFDNGIKIVDNHNSKELVGLMSEDFQKKYIKEMLSKFGEEFAISFVNILSLQKQKLQEEFEEKRKSISDQLDFLK